MVLQNSISPDAIPPRTSSNSMAAMNMLSTPHTMTTDKPVLSTLPEEHWLASAKQPHTTITATTMQASSNELKELGHELKNLGDGLIHQTQQPWSAEKEKILLAPYEYLDGHPGKDIRSQLIAAFNEWLQVPAASLAVITKVVGMLHTASLLVDDVEDSSSLRRGIPVAHSIFGTAQTINSANYIYFVALQELAKLNSPNALMIYTEELLNLHRGQGLDLYWRDSLLCPSEADYLEMVHNKTGGLFRLAIKLMQDQSLSGIDCLPLVNTVGLLFQILDDHLNLSSYSSTKGFCEDLTEGKFSFPVIHAMHADPTNRVLLSILKQKTTDVDVKKYAVKYMDSVGSFEYTRNCVLELKRKAEGFVDEIETLLGEEGAVGAAGLRLIVAKIVEKMKAPVVV